ncbi:MAG: hypothetical protein ACI8WB_001302, partial [Phenylobacterium sp.]
MPTPIKVFISYSHDSEAHAKKVLQFANLLRDHGYEVMIDQQIGDPPEGWPLWMNNGMDDADFVLLICTETYKKRVMGKEKEGLGFGCRFEGKVIYNIIYNITSKSASRNTKFLPVLFDVDNKQYIPDLVSGDTFYLVQDEAGFANLKRKLDNKHQAKAAPLGKHQPVDDLPDPGAFFEQGFEPDTAKQPLQIDLSAMPVSTGTIVGREKEIEQLNKSWQDHNTRVISFIAWGGVGKSSLINHWLNHMDENGFKGAAQVFAHSFYSQGSSNQRHVSAEHFINQAYQFLQYTGDRPTSPHDQGLQLAKLFSARKTLLILDGLEPMQYPPGDLQGRLKDQSLAALLKNLAFNLPGLCVITSRVEVFELQSTNCPNYPLEQLSIEAGLQVLANNRVSGPKAEMVKAVEEVEGHALTLALLGSYIKTVYQGDIGQRDQMSAYISKRPQGRHAKKVMASYHDWLEDKNSPELDILHILGLFDRPASMDAINVLKTAPAIAGISERIQILDHEDWAYAVE